MAEEKGIDPAPVEKDDWIMHCVYGLQQIGFTFQLKGGTSLSKGHQIINRFSEDIDIPIVPPKDRDVPSGSTGLQCVRTGSYCELRSPARRTGRGFLANLSRRSYGAATRSG